MAKSDISPREAQILDLMAEGLAEKQIGDRLGISPRTVQNHKQRIFRKTLQASTTSAAVWWVLYGKHQRK